MRGHRDLTAAVVIAAVAAAGALLAPGEAVRLCFAAPLALALPGYAICAATLADADRDRGRLLVLSLGLSLCTLVLGSLLLNLLPGGLSAESWALLLLLVVLLAARAAALRRPASAGGSRPRRSSWSRQDAGAAAALAAAALLGAAALALAFLPTASERASGFTELWLSPAGAGSDQVKVGVGSQEQSRTAYLLEVDTGGGAPLLRRLELEPGERTVLRVGAGARAAGPQPVSAVLYRAAEPARPYRQVGGWISSSGGSQR